MTTVHGPACLLQRILPMLCALALSAQAAEPDQAPENARLRMGLASTRAVAAFRSAQNVSGEMHARGWLPRAEFVSLRAAIECRLDRAETELAKGAWEAAGLNLNVAEALLARFERLMGSGR